MATTSTKIPLAKCREILGSINVELTDAQLKEIRDFLYQLAQIEFEQYQLRNTK